MSSRKEARRVLRSGQVENLRQQYEVMAFHSASSECCVKPEDEARVPMLFNRQFLTPIDDLKPCSSHMANLHEVLFQAMWQTFM